MTILQSAAAGVLAVTTISGAAIGVETRYAHQAHVAQLENQVARGQLNSQRIILEQELFAWRAQEQTRKLSPLEFQRKLTVERELENIREYLKRLR